MFIPRNMLITGGAGFIGSNFVHYMLRIDPAVKILNLDSLTYAGSMANLEGLQDPARHHFVRGSICDGELVAQLLREHHIDTVVHFAPESHVDRSITEQSEFVQTNIVGTLDRKSVGQGKSGTVGGEEGGRRRIK